MRQREATDSEQGSPMLFISWETIEELTQALASRLLADGRPEVLVSLQRGGLIPGVLLSHQLAVSEILSVPIRRTLSDAAYADKQAPRLSIPEQALHLTDKDVVLVDDIVGSGETMLAALSALVAFHPARLRTMSYLVNLTHWEHAHRHPPEQEITYIGQIIRAWAVFPWESSARTGILQEGEPGCQREQPLFTQPRTEKWGKRHDFFSQIWSPC